MMTAFSRAIQVFSRSSSARERSPIAKAITTGVATPMLAIRMKTIHAIVSSAVETPAPAIAAAPATASSRFLGLSPDRNMRVLIAFTGVNPSSAPIHLGVAGSSSPSGRPRHWRAATSSMRTPRISLSQLTHVAGAPSLVAPAPLESDSTSMGADRRVWRPVMGRLAAERDVLAVDLPGFGDSPPLIGAAPPDPRALARALNGLLASLGLAGGRAHLAGNSLGGWVALEAALAGDAASVTAIAPAGLWARPLPPKPEVARRAARALRPLLGPALRVGPVRRATLLGTVAHPERVPAADAAALVGAYARAPAFSAVNRAMRAGTFTRLADIGVPVTLVWPQHDRLIQRPRMLPGGVQQIVIPDAGHVPMWDAPGAVAEALLAGSATPAGREAA